MEGRQHLDMAVLDRVRMVSVLGAIVSRMPGGEFVSLTLSWSRLLSFKLLISLDN
jgi:hypothetical protein